MRKVVRLAPIEAAPPAMPHVLVLVADSVSRRELLAAIVNGARISILERAGSIPEIAPVDVALIHTDYMSQACAPLLCDARLGSPEIVFVVDEEGSPQHLALESRGLRYVVSRRLLPKWLPAAMPRLTSIARARRIVLGTCTADDPMVPEQPSLKVRLRGRQLRLREAETSFRDAFMRTLLAECGSRRKAADEAGVPYRSFCEMLRKLGI